MGITFDGLGDPLELRPWERRSRPDRLNYHVTYDMPLPDGSRHFVISSPWVVQLVRADGSAEPISRIAGCIMREGDRLTIPESASTPVDAEAVSAARRQGLAEYTLAHAPRFDEDEESRLRFDFERPDPERWWWYRRELPHGLVLHLHPASHNARLSVSLTGALGFEGGWCYPDHADGWRAALTWNGWRDPPDGWARHTETLRRRKDGTVASEYVSVHDVPEAREWP